MDMANSFNKNIGDKKHLLSQFKLRTQMLFGYAIPVFMFAGSTYIVYSNANKVFEAFNQVENVQKSIIEVDKMALAGSNMVANSRGYIISEESQFLELYQQSWQSFQEASNTLDNTITVLEQRQRFEQMKEIAKNYNQYQNQLASLLGQGKRKEALELFKTGIGSKLLLDFLTLNSDFNKTEITRLNTENLQARNTLQNAINLLVLGSIVSALTAFIIAWLISSLVSRKITQAIDAIDNSSLEINIAVDQQEKITSSQASSVNETTRTMDELEFSATQASETGGNFNIRSQTGFKPSRKW
ncbi:MAG: CHASE3 domain-containing protein [Planktothrix sp. GU0601_MAG3]|nr:MAG: CHASE3 domain-containing protein [Planktothrix sp. GU0601_MAG3]